jgi:ATP-dependent DNA helicase RecQ
MLDDHDEPIRPTQLKDELNASTAKGTRAVNLLEQAGVVATTDVGRLEHLDPDLPAGQAVEHAVDVAETHQRMIPLADRDDARLRRDDRVSAAVSARLLWRATGPSCGNCDTCEAGTAEEQQARDDAFPLNGSVRDPEWGHGVVMSIEHDRLIVLFDEVGYKTLSLPALQERDLLARD